MIPNCLQCADSSTCNLCKAGYIRANITDAEGQVNAICVAGLCGFYGEGSGCKGEVGIEGCDKSMTLIINGLPVENCVRCTPGYFMMYNRNFDPDFNEVFTCSP